MPMRTNLKHFYLDDLKLAQLAWLEFTRALRSGRMVAFVGSMATEAFGYGKWESLPAKHLTLAQKVVDDIVDIASRESRARRNEATAAKRWFNGTIKPLKTYPRKGSIAATVRMGLVEEVLDSDRILSIFRPPDRPDWPLDEADCPSDLLSSRISKIYRTPSFTPLLSCRTTTEFETRLDAIRILFDDLDIKRFLTVNYDFEIERKTMLRDIALDKDGGFSNPFDELVELRNSRGRQDAEIFDWNLGSGRIRRVLAHGKAAESDLLNRERIDRLLEFAIGADDVDSHVMHMHGRACNWRSMIVTHRDYGALYRRNDLNRLPFEFAKRLMMGGNPILFVGLGMSEADINRELEEFVSNTPYHRAAPAFLLWSQIPAQMTAADMQLRRLDWLHRLGVLTIFDADLVRMLSDGPYGETPGVSDWLDEGKALADIRAARRTSAAAAAAAAGVELKALAWGARGLALGLKAPPREDHVGADWRSSLCAKSAEDIVNPRILWGREPAPASDEIPPPAPALLEQALRGQTVFVVGPQGCGKGSQALSLAHGLAKSGRRCLLINGGFSFDTDSMLTGIREYICHIVGDQDQFDHLSKRQIFMRFEGGSLKEKISIIINGAERFFNLAGKPISAELDELLKLNIPNICWTIFGTERIRAYAIEFWRREPQLLSELVEPGETPEIPIRHFECIRRKFAERSPQRADAVSPGDWRNVNAEIDAYLAFSAGRLSGDSENLRRAFYSWALDNDTLAIVLRDHPSIPSKDETQVVRYAQRILRTLAFFGLPVEAEVLAKAPALSQLPTGAGLARARLVGWLRAVLEKLTAAGLVLPVHGYGGYGDQTGTRYVLHRSLLTELRSRFGIPLTEAKLSTSFNMSLYVAQPLDGYIPEPEMHDELGALIDRLVGAYRDVGDDATARRTLDDAQWRVNAGRTAPPSLRTALMLAGRACRHSGGVDADRELLRIHQLCGATSVQRLRGALAVVRGYYSTTGILTLDTGDRLLREDRDGVLLEHAERLDRLIDAYAKISQARGALKKALGEDLFVQIYQAGEPFYADELVWLHNERGVVRLAMGDLYEARASFQRALKVNRFHVEFDDRAHNWRRIRVNQLTMHMEMGDIGLARRMAEEIISVSRQRSPRLREDRLAIAIATGHLAWSRHLQGEYETAISDYEIAIRQLRNLDEIRAQAFFTRLSVDALELTGDPLRGRAERERALDLAQSTRQMDLVYRVQISLANDYYFQRKDGFGDAKRAHRLLEEALQYALQADAHRVRCEASMTTARFRYDAGDYEGALRFASDALMVATRYGMELRKITLRADIARIMAARGHPVTAQNLALAAVSIASRLRFQTALDRAERVLLEIPQLSAAIGASDGSGRRNF
jgi:tetratricopeptide (TPR) repeat protein